MANLVKGPFELKWGDNVLTDVEEIEVEYDVDTEDYTTVQGRTYEFSGAHKVAVNLTLLGADVAALAAVLPQYHVNNGGVLSTGETVNEADGAMDIVPGGCDTTPVYKDLDIISCANPGKVYRVVNARTEIAGVEFDDKVRKVMVRFLGESDADEATVQFFEEGSISVVS